MRQVIIRESNFQKARKKIRENKNKDVIFSGKTDKLNRKVLEKENIDFLLINLSGRKDRMKQRDSGFNHVLAKLAKKNRVGLGINLDEILHSKTPKKKSEIIGRLRQNIKLCKKNKLKMKFISVKGKKKDPRDLKSLGLVLGMSTKMVKEVS